LASDEQMEPCFTLSHPHEENAGKDPRAESVVRLFMRKKAQYLCVCMSLLSTYKKIDEIMRINFSSTAATFYEHAVTHVHT